MYGTDRFCLWGVAVSSAAAPPALTPEGGGFCSTVLADFVFLSVWKGSLSGPLLLLVWKLVSGCLCWSEEISDCPMYARRQKDDSSEVELSPAVLCVNRLRSWNSLRGSSSVDSSLAMLFGCGGCSPACSGESLVDSFFSGGSLDLWWLDDACPVRCGVFTRVEAS
ncbi:Uncharacterized protein Rs2_26811 [Raphanus sativus]|nr:Uncharacterized protein Rs2_26811 [Raphanus sativus]